MSRLRTASILALAALLAGCGSSDGTDTTASPSAPAKSAPASADAGGKLRLGVTDSGIGRATTGSADGIDVLPTTPVPGQSNTLQGVGAGAKCADADLLPEVDNLAAVQKATLCLLNGERADAGLRALKENAKLADAAAAHSKAMVDGQFFDHIGTNGSDPVSRIRKAGYIPGVGTWTVGENLAWGSGALSTPKAIVGAWMKSQGHRENILRSSYKEIGFGLVAGNPRSRGDSGATFTTTFGVVSTPRKVRRARSGRIARRSSRKRVSATASRPRGG